MKKKYITGIAAGLCISILAGCQETPENSIVKQKGTESIKEYESGEETASPLKEILGVPEHYSNKKSYEEGALVIDTDAEVILPEASSINTYQVSAKEVNQDMIDQVTKTFFEGDKIYHAHSYGQWTKEQYQEDITVLKKYKAEGNLDPYDYGKDENGQLQFDIDAVIARDEEAMKDAPDEVVKEEVTPAFGLEYWNGKGEEKEKEVDERSFYGVAETDQGNYNYMISYDLAPDIVFKISKIREDIADPREFSSWLETEYVMGTDPENENYVSEDTVKKFLNISYEDAEKTAREKVEKLGWNLELYNWDYAVFHHGEGGVREDNIIDGGYIFHFTRKLDQVPVTYTSSYGGGLEDMDSTLEPWSYERCDVIVGDDGIQNVEIYNPYEIGEIQTEHVKLMDFDSIVKIYEQMMEVSNADISEFEKNRTYHIKKITLGYSRIYDPTTENDVGLLVPVWDFFGGFDVENEDYTEKNSGEYSNQSFMTINAIDGTVIDRGLGY
ncbi:MAG: hypothetical protein HFH41_13795 [Lachnospiraceae bacterium]|nr:hypothetical protein [Lachnospiraceae bacterium]